MSHPLKNQFDSIIFDLDGTLWDSTHNVVSAWQAAIEEVDYVTIEMTQEKVRSITGLAYNVIFDTLFPDLDIIQREEIKGLCAKHEIAFLKKMVEFCTQDLMKHSIICNQNTSCL